MSKVAFFNNEEIDFLCKLIETKNDELLSGSEIKLKKSIYEKLLQEPKQLSDTEDKIGNSFYEDGSNGDYECYTKRCADKECLPDHIQKIFDSYKFNDFDVIFDKKNEVVIVESDDYSHILNTDELEAIINKAYELFGGRK